jgi:hypothetical protein
MNKIIGSEPREDGQSMVELALTLTLLLILLAGTIDFGRAFFTWIEMRDAAQEGATYGSFCPDKSKITARVDANLNKIYTYHIDPIIPAYPAPGDSITVNVETKLPLAMPFLSTVIQTDTIAIHATIIDTIINTSCP